MDEIYLYQQIAEDIRQRILSGELKPGDRLPSVRSAAQQHNCTVATIQRAYRVLVQHGLIVSRAGRGTRVVDRLPASLQSEKPLRRAALVNRAEAFLLELLSSGHELSEIEAAFHQAMDRWRIVEKQPSNLETEQLRFVGSHDPVIVWLAGIFPQITAGCQLNLHFAGSLGGLAALVEGQADLAGIHLWDEESDQYNIPFVRRFLPHQRVALVTLALRRLGLILPPGNPLQVRTLQDLFRLKLRVASRQVGSGTRLWLDARMKQSGFEHGAGLPAWVEKATHSDVARAVAEGQVEAGIGVQAAAISMELDFIELTLERYDLVIPHQTMETRLAQLLVQVLQESWVRETIHKMGGYEIIQTGTITWLE